MAQTHYAGIWIFRIPSTPIGLRIRFSIHAQAATVIFHSARVKSDGSKICGHSIIESVVHDTTSKTALLNHGVKMLGMIRDGSSLTTDAEGYIIDPSQWTDDFADEVARREGINLTNEHWGVIRFMRAWLEDRGVAPDARHVMKFLAGDREAGRGRLFELFPYGYVKQACKIAGMKKPRAWSTG